MVGGSSRVTMMKPAHSRTRTVAAFSSIGVHSMAPPLETETSTVVCSVFPMHIDSRGPDGWTLARRPHNEQLIVLGDLGWTFRPECLDFLHPAGNRLPKALLGRVLGRAQLRTEAVRSEEGRERLPTVNDRALPYNPHVEVEKAWCVRQGGNDFALYRDSVFIKPEPHAIEKMKSHGINLLVANS